MHAELRTLIKEVAADHPGADYRELADHVAKLTPAEQVLDFYTDALVSVVIEELSLSRRNSFPNSSPAPSNRSSKLEERRDWWSQMLTERLAVGDGAVKPLGDCTVEDLQFAVELRETQISGLRRQVNNFKQLQKLLVEHKAETVKDLPPQQDWPVK